MSFMLQPCGPGAAPVTRANVQTAEEYVAEVWAASVVDLLNIIFYCGPFGECSFVIIDRFTCGLLATVLITVLL